MVEQRLDQATLAPVMLALAREEALAEHPLRRLHRRPLREAPAVRREDVPDEVRPVQDVQVESRHADPHDVALTRGSLEELERVAAEEPDRRDR